MLLSKLSHDQMEPSLRPSGIIFDFDGVLVDSLPAHLQAWADAVSEIFNRSVTDLSDLSGHSSRTIAHILAKRYGDPSLANILVKTKERLLASGAIEVPLYPGVKSTIEFLAVADLPFAIGSNSLRPFVMATTARVGLHVPVIVTASDVSRHKPAPDIFCECSNGLRIDPKQRQNIIVFDDSIHGIKAAVAAGMTPIGISSSTKPESLFAAGAVAVTESVAEAFALGWMQQMPRKVQII